MAKGNAVWGIDIGQCAFKALRCTYDARAQQLVADACDFIEYPKILSQPDADPESLVRDAIKEFLSRNSVRGDRVAISVAGQQGLARFIKLPPVEAKKVPDIVKYEAKQQIPFALEDVIWDYQTLVGGGDFEGMALETEVGLFAMKRDQVFRAIRPLDDAGIEIDLIQLTPVCVYNATVHSVLGELPAVDEYDPDSPPPSVVVLSMGTDTTDLVVTNGFRVWQRSIPLGGNHFTKQLTKELKLTFAKAEHLKRNSREAEDPKKVFQAMRPVFNDMVTEVQRSIGYFESLDRNAKIDRIVGFGNAFKLPGLEPYLEKNLGHKVKLISSFKQLSGPALEESKFKQNIHSLAVCYGLALQGLNQAKLRTNLVPRELLRARMVREKKPWVLAATSLLMAGLAMSFLFHWYRSSQVAEDRYSSQFQQVSQVASTSSSFVSADNTNQTKFDDLRNIGDQIVGGSDRRFQMLELVQAINQALPRERNLKPGELSELPLAQRPTLYIESVESQYYGGEENLSEWFDEDVSAAYAKTLVTLQSLASGEKQPEVEAVAEDAATGDAAAGDDLADAGDMEEAEADATADVDVGTLEGEGWVIELSGYHYHNAKYPMAGAEYVRRTLIKELMTGTVTLPTPDGPQQFTMAELGISHVLLAHDGRITTTKVRNPKFVRTTPLDDFDPQLLAERMKDIPGISAKAPASAEEIDDKPKEEEFLRLKTNEFKVQFVWRPKRLKQRLEDRQKAADENSIDNQVAGDI